MRVSRRGNYWTGWYQLKYFPLPPIITYSEIVTSGIAINASGTNTFILKNTISESIESTTSLIIGMFGSISETITFSSTLSNVYTALETLLETIVSDDTVSTRLVGVNSLVELIVFLDGFSGNKAATINEVIAIDTLASALGSLVNTILETVVTATSTSNKSIALLTIEETTLFTDAISSKLILKESLSESFVLTIPTASGQDTYLAYLLSPETMGVTNYENYNFNGCTKFGDKYLFFNSSGLYEYGANTDDGTKISIDIETAAFTFGTTNLKNVPSVYMGVASTGATYLKVRVDGKGVITYKLSKNTEELQTQKIALGKGLIGRYFQFEIITDADEFNLESIEFYPIELKRKL